MMNQVPPRTHAVVNNRIVSIDVVRGIVMILKALDHVRDLLHISSLTQSPTDLATTTPVLFFSRWVTHLCAPIFQDLSTQPEAQQIFFRHKYSWSFHQYVCRAVTNCVCA